MIRIRLKELMWEKNKSGIELFKATGISQSNISEIIRGKRTNITLQTIEKICLFLDCNINELIEIKSDSSFRAKILARGFKMAENKKIKKNKKKKFDISNMGVDIDKNEYREIVMSQSNHPERMDKLLKDYRF